MIEYSPLWHRLKPETIAKLIQYQWKHFGTHLDLFTKVIKPRIEKEVESPGLEEIDRMMRQTPTHPKKVD